jgi:excisionase family DNA binding protein
MTTRLSTSEPAGGSHMNVITPALSQLYLLNEAAELLGMHRETARRLVVAGEFPVPAFKVGGRWFIRRSELDAFLQGA